MTTNEVYGLKLRLIFHDLPTKPADIVGHEKRAEKAYEDFISGTGLPKADDKFVKSCDRLAAAADRIKLSRFIGDLKKLAREIYGEPEEPRVEKVSLISPVKPSEEKFQSFQRDLKVGFDEAFINELIRLAKGRKVFEAYLSVLRNLEPVWSKIFRERLGYSSVTQALILPADTRFPCHTVFDHLRASAALATALHTPEGLIGLVRAEVPGIQTFISEAAKLRDLWARSWLISAVTIYALTKLFDEESGYSPDSVVMPYLLDNAFIDAWLKGKHNIRVEDERASLEITEPIIPGAFTLIAKPDDSDVVKRLTEYFNEAFRKIFEAVKEWLNDRIRGGFWEEVWDSNIWPPLKLSVAGKAYSESEFENYAELVKRVGSLLNSTKEAERGVLARTDKWYRLGEYPELKFSGSSYNERLALTNNERENPKSFTRMLSEEFWEGEERERLDPLSLTCRFLAKEGLFEEVVKKLFGVNCKPGLPFLSTPDAASMEFRLTLLSLIRVRRPKEVLECIRQLHEKFFELVKHEKEKAREALEARRALISLSDFKKLCTDDWLNESDGLDFEVKHWVSFVDGEWFYPDTWTRNVERWREAGKLSHDRYEEAKKVAEEAGRLLRKLYEYVGKNIKDLNREVEKKFKIRLIPVSKPKLYYAIVRADADNLGKEILSGKILISYKDAFKKLIEEGKIWVRNKGDIDIKELVKKSSLEELLSQRLEVTPAYHSLVSRALASIAREAVKLIREHHGLQVYVGGDDLLAVLPPETAPEFIREARKVFSRSWLETREGAEIIGLGPRASQSFSILYAHYLTPLNIVIEQSTKLLEEHSKKTSLTLSCGEVGGFEKNAVAVARLTRGGELELSTLPFGVKGEENLVEFWDAALKLSKNSQIPKSLLRELLVILEELELPEIRAEVRVVTIRREVERRLAEKKAEEFYKSLKLPNREEENSLNLLASASVKSPHKHNSLIFNIVRVAEIIKSVIES